MDIFEQTSLEVVIFNIFIDDNYEDEYIPVIHRKINMNINKIGKKLKKWKIQKQCRICTTKMFNYPYQGGIYDNTTLFIRDNSNFFDLMSITYDNEIDDYRFKLDIWFECIHRIYNGKIMNI